MSQTKISKVLFSPALTLPLALLVGPFFVWSKNWHMYTWGELVLSMAVLVGCALLLGAAGWLLPKMAARSRTATALTALVLATLVVEGLCIFFDAEFHNLIHTWQMRLLVKEESVVLLSLSIYFITVCPWWSQYRRGAHLISGFFLCVATVEILLFFLNIPIKTSIDTHNGLVALHICTIALFCLIMWRFGSGIINIFFLTCLCIFTMTAIIYIMKDIVYNKNTLIETDNSSIILTKKPNIYLFWMESTQGFDTLKSIFNMDTEPFQIFLKDNGFKVYPNVFSDGIHTLHTMYIVNTMQNNDSKSFTNNDVLPHVRSVLAGDENNVLLATLKSNGYHTVYLTMTSPYYFTESKGNLDETDIRVSYKRLRPLRELNPVLNSGQQFSVGHKFFGSLPERVHQAMTEGLTRKQPLFLSFKGGSEHTPVPREKYTFRRRFEWVASGKYQRHLEQGFKDAEVIISDILEHDPHSVIILMGDHGPRRLRHIEDGVKPGDLAGLAHALSAEGESLESFARDLFDILLAIRMPDGARDISQGHLISPVNLFRHVFMAINNDSSVLDKRVPQISMVNGTILVREGKVQHP